MVSGDLGFAWRFSPLDMPNQPRLEILQTHFEEEAFVCPERKPDKGGEQIKEQFPALPLQNCTGFNSVCVRPPSSLLSASSVHTQPPLTLPALLSVARARASWIRAPGFALVLVSLVRRELEQSWRATSSFSLLPPSLLVSSLNIDHRFSPVSHLEKIFVLFFASYIAVEPSCVTGDIINNHSIWKSNSVFSLILIKITSICS